MINQKLQLVIVLLLFYCISSAQCTLANTKTFTSQCEIDEFAEQYAGCDTIYGNVEIGFSEQTPEYDQITDLSAFNFVKYIGGYLSIRNITNIVDLNGFQSLEYIGGALVISECSDLRNIDQLEQLKHASSFHFFQNFSIQSMPQFSFDSLEFASFYHLPEDNLEFLQKLKYAKVLELTGNELLSSCIGLNEEIKVESLYLRNNPNLTECAVDVLCERAKESLDDLYIYGNGAGCSNVEEFAAICLPDTVLCFNERITLIGQSELETLSSIEADCIDQVKEVILRESSDDPIVDLSPLSIFSSLEELNLSSLNVIEDLEGLESLDYCERIIISRCENLRSLEAFDENLEIGSYVQLFHNPTLSDLGNFMTSHSIPDVQIEQCESLSQAEYDKLDKVRGIYLSRISIESSNFISTNSNLTRIRIYQVESSSELELIELNGIEELRIWFQSNKLYVTNIGFADSVSTIEFFHNEDVHFDVKKPPLFVENATIYENEFNQFEFNSGCKYFGAFNFSNNKGVESLDLFNELEEINKFAIYSNPDLEVIGKTSQLMKSLDEISLVKNPVLSTIDGFENPLYSAKIDINGNPLLNDCALGLVCETLASRTAEVFILGNGGTCNFDALVINCGIQNPIRSITIRNQNDINQLANAYPVMDSIFGSLTFELDYGVSEDNLDLSFFENLVFIQDEFIVDGSKTSYFDFSFFDDCFYNSIEISHIEAVRMPTYHGASSISGILISESVFSEGLPDFAGLERIGVVHVNVPGLAVNTEFADLIDVGTLSLDQISIGNNAFEKLESSNSLDFNNLTLDNIAMFENVYINKFLTIANCNDLTEINLDQFTYGYDFFQLVIKNNLNLKSLSGLNFDRSYRRFSIHINENTSLETLNVLEFGKKISVIRVKENELLDSIQLGALETASIIEIKDNSALNFLELSVLAHLNSLIIERNSKLEGIDDIVVTADIGLIRLRDNENLVNCNIELLCHNYILNNQFEIENNGETCFPEDLLDYCLINSQNIPALDFTVFPNPTYGILRSESFKDEARVKLISVHGAEYQIPVNDDSINLKDLPSGLYYVILGENEKESQLIVKY